MFFSVVMIVYSLLTLIGIYLSVRGRKVDTEDKILMAVVFSVLILCITNIVLMLKGGN